MPTITIPEPTKIHNHPDGCDCKTCAGARARLLKSPYVKNLRAFATDLIARLSVPAPSTGDLEARVIALTAKNQELEEGNALLRQTIQAGETTTSNLRATILDRDREIKRLSDHRSLTADELGAAQAEADKWRGDFAKLRDDHAKVVRQEMQWRSELEKIRGSLSATHWHGDFIDRDLSGGVSGLLAGYKLALADAEHFNKLYTEQESRLAEKADQARNVSQHQATRIEELKTERDGLAADLQRMTGEANKQRQAADGAKAELGSVTQRNTELVTDNAALAEQLSTLRANKGIGAIAATFVAAIIWGLIGWIVGRYGR